MTAGLADFAVRSRTAVVGGFNVAYVDEGTGRPVVCVHGNPSWSVMWRPLLAGLRDGYRVIAPDHVGMGRSAKPPASRYPYTLDRRVADFGELLAGLDLAEPVTLVVHDWGGVIGLAWAVANPSRVASVVVLNTAAWPLPAGGRLPLALRAARAPVLGDLAVRGLGAFSHGAVRRGVRHPLPAPVRRAYLAPYDSWANRRAVLAFVRDIPVRRADPAYPTVAAVAERLSTFADRPALICWGLRDPVFDAAYLREWRRVWPQAQVHAFADAGHYVLEDAADRVVPLVRDFLDHNTLR